MNGLWFVFLSDMGCTLYIYIYTSLNTNLITDECLLRQLGSGNQFHRVDGSFPDQRPVHSLTFQQAT